MDEAEISGGGSSRPSELDADRLNRVDHSRTPAARRIAVVSLIIFFAALGVRLLSMHDAALEVGKVQTSVTSDYKLIARLLLQGGVGSFVSPSSPLANPDTLGHPPGYSILLALTFRAFGESDAAVQFIQIACDALACVALFLIVAELLTVGVAAVAGALSALSPQFAWNSVVLLPDSLAVLPLLFALYLIARASRRSSLPMLFAAGALVGVSCWLRANALLLAPFLCLCAPQLFGRGHRLRGAAALLGGSLLVIAPLTIRNAVVFGHFIPLSLGAGQTMLEGIGDYDRAGRFGIPQTDLGILKQEAEVFNRPDYYGTLFGPDGVKRERMRVARAWRVVGSHPAWFAGVMLRRAASMLRLERAPLVSPRPPVTHPLEVEGERQPVWSASPAELLAAGVARSSRTTTSLPDDAQTLRVEGDDTKYGEQFRSAPISVRKDTDYLLTLPVKAERGRVKIGVANAGEESLLSATLAAAVEGKTPEQQPVQEVQLPFVSGGADAVRLILRNEGSQPVARVGSVRLFELGPASRLWSRYPRALVHGAQRLFLTAAVLPLAFAGALLLARARRRRALVLLLVLPAYYMCVQSALHTEYRYTMIIYHFLFALAAVTLATAFGALTARAAGRRAAPRLLNKSEVA
jgi:hypothetical protein